MEETCYRIESEPGVIAGKGCATFIDRSRLDTVFDECINQWVRDYPDQAYAFPAHMARIRAMHADGKAYGRSMWAYYIGEIPRPLYSLIAKKLGTTDWLMDEEVMKRWWARFTAGRITPKDGIPEDATKSTRKGPR